MEQLKKRCGKGPFVRPRWCREREALSFVGVESVTQASHFDQTDVNAIVARFERTGALPPSRQQGIYADVTGLQGDLTEMIEASRRVMTGISDYVAGVKDKKLDPPVVRPSPTAGEVGESSVTPP